jgi:outer membrane lipoprotein SlyB
VARSTVGGRVSVGFGEGRGTVLTAGNGALAPGWIGFGVRGGPAHFDQVRLWAPEWTMRSLDFLPPPLQGAQSRR